MRSAYLLLGVLLLPMTTAAQEQSTEKNQFGIEMQLRTRGEYRNGAQTPREEGERAATFISNRSRLSMDYARSFDAGTLPTLKMRMGIQHVGVWGQDPAKDKNGRLSLNEAWARIEGHQGLFAQIGRQQLAYDDERLFSKSDWNVAGCWHDALRLGYETSVRKLHVILAYNQNKENVKGGNYFGDGGQAYKNMQTVWYHYQTEKLPVALSWLFANVGQESGVPEKAKTSYKQTMGTHVTYTSGKWNFSSSFYLQTGKDKERLSTAAFMVALRAGCTINKQWKINAGYDYLSGDRYDDVEQTTDGSYRLVKKDTRKTNAFSTLFGSGHGFYGSMDYFYASDFANGFNPGLQDLQLSTVFMPSKRVSMSLTCHNFATASDILVAGKSLGTEVDYRIDWNVMKDVSLLGGYSLMRGTRTMDIVKGGNHRRWQDWAWVTLNINPRIFFAK